MSAPDRPSIHVSPQDYFARKVDRAVADVHLATCADCRARLDAARARLREFTCRQLVEIVTDYLEGVVDEQLHGRIEEHLELCEGCRNYVDQMRSTLETVGRIPPEPHLPAEVRAALLAAFRARHGSSGDGGS